MRSPAEVKLKYWWKLSTIQLAQVSDSSLCLQLTSYFLFSLKQTTMIWKHKFCLFANNFDYKGPEIPCLRIIKKCINMKTAVANGNTNVCKL